MGLPQDFSTPVPSIESDSPLSKRRRFTPHSLPPIIPIADNSDIEQHTFDSPLLLQLCEQAPDQAEIEAGLLQVGMRVRKAVAEGYKTQKKFTPRPFFNMHRLSPETQAALSSGNADTTNELSPYSAAQVQPLTTATFCGISLAYLSHCSEDWSSPSIAEQSLWSYSTSHKRSYEADSDSDDSQDWQPQTPSLVADAGMHMPVDYFAIDIDTMSDVSPMTQVGDRARQHLNGRRMAMPKTRGRFFQQPETQMPPTSAANPFANMIVHQPDNQLANHFGHKRMVSCGMEAAMDFGEASFLQRREDVEMDCS
ncbi:uncharacterized protein PV07_03847 [Cladophialophora immunda]|uniref:Uncharacterized protein n=1 Tax=Cladophialophora immunda TaxID=569365 RepID=A0A0D2D989_9EURO|nr:uncharacterized protein PV07_03847 [Cladophialophora immunda]KIW32289.1 hypothetical protein PV07_03847 [Cladophialophora immunda]OQV09534.1 hypothetical protein CLAIMM_13647 [Cladophialophora immunda]